MILTPAVTDSNLQVHELTN